MRPRPHCAAAFLTASKKSVPRRARQQPNDAASSHIATRAQHSRSSGAGGRRNCHKETLENLRHDPRVAIGVHDYAGKVAMQIHGRAEILDQGDLVEEMRQKLRR